MELINKVTILSYINKRLHKYEKEYEELAHYEIWTTANNIKQKIEELKNFRSFIETLEIKDVDLETAFAASIDHFD